MNQGIGVFATGEVGGVRNRQGSRRWDWQRLL